MRATATDGRRARGVSPRMFASTVPVRVTLSRSSRTVPLCAHRARAGAVLTLSRGCRGVHAYAGHGGRGCTSKATA